MKGSWFFSVRGIAHLMLVDVEQNEIYHGDYEAGVICHRPGK